MNWCLSFYSFTNDIDRNRLWYHCLCSFWQAQYADLDWSVIITCIDTLQCQDVRKVKSYLWEISPDWLSLRVRQEALSWSRLALWSLVEGVWIYRTLNNDCVCALQSYVIYLWYLMRNDGGTHNTATSLPPGTWDTKTSCLIWPKLVRSSKAERNRWEQALNRLLSSPL